MSPASSPAPGPPSRCSRPRTPPATGSRSCSACRSRSSSTIRRATSRWGRGCRPRSRSGSIPVRRFTGSCGNGCERRVGLWRQSVADRNSGGVRLVHGGARYHHRQCRAALYRRRSRGQHRRGVLGGDHLSGRQRRQPDRERLSCPIARAQGVFPDLPGAVHRQFGAVRLFRLAQGLGGGGMVPLAQSILADAFPPEKRGQGFALFGVAVVVAPVVGPTLGGWLADNLSWRWCFLINAPVGLAALALIAALLPPPDAATQRRRLLEQ